MVKAVYAFSKSFHEEVRISARRYRDELYIDLRIYYRNGGTNEMLPSRKGITLPLDQIKELAKGLKKIDPGALKCQMARSASFGPC